MSELPSSTRAKRPEFRNINAFTDLPTYRMTPAAIVSILHRGSGLIMFLLMPFIIWMFDTSVSSEFSFARFTSAFNNGIGFVPGVFIKLVALALIWAYAHHLLAGLRHIRLAPPKRPPTFHCTVVRIENRRSAETSGFATLPS